MTSQNCFETLAPHLAVVQKSVMTAPLNKDERVQLATMIAGFFCSTAVDCGMVSLGENNDARENVMQNVFMIISQSIRKSHNMKPAN